MQANTDFFLVKDQAGGFHKINYADVCYIKSAGNYLKIKTTQDTITTHGSLQSIEDILQPDARFMRIHRSFIVNLYQIDHISSEEMSIGKEKVPIGNKFLEPLKTRFIQHYLLKI